MKYDVIIIGAGFGGLSCASLLAKKGKKVLLLEKSLHSGGTSSVFSRKGYLFPMGPLGFSQPQRILNFMEEIGISQKPTFKRTHYQLKSPALECIYSVPFEELREKLRHIYPKESRIDDFFDKLRSTMSKIKDLDKWHMDNKKMNSIAQYAHTPGNEILDSYFSDVTLKNFLGSMGTHPSRMSLLNLSVMWHLMAEIGIWFPSCGIHGLIQSIESSFLAFGGELRLGQAVQEILLKGGKAAGVKTADGDVLESNWVVSNADTKKTFLELIDEKNVSSSYLKNIRNAPYSESELCVYLGLDPSKVDWKAMKTRHLFYRHKLDLRKRFGLTDFANREIAITLWSDNLENLAPPQKKSLVLRVGFPFGHFSDFWVGEKKRKPEYQEYKKHLAKAVVQTAEKILPGLGSSIEVIEAATPLTYKDWGNRYQGSIAGWAWGVKNKSTTGSRLLIQTPIPNLLMAGIYAASELFLGGVPTAVHTGYTAAKFICRKKGTAPF
ncbi:MAG: NAD(P)/FAD-dependent oxidoreductase [Candidatus Aminicenantes bacterium]|nr:MAG: NAD(P)/FAD-dependent oxidoreductase [Candidatus Aminicenantes bacterium]